MTRSALLFIVVAALSGEAFAGPAGDVDAYVRGRLHVTNYAWAEADLNGDGAPEQFIYATDADGCGSGGCTLFVLTKEAETYRLVLRSTLIQRPVRLLRTQSQGWRDIAVNISGGGVTPGAVRLSFNGFKYPANPTLAPRLSAATLKASSIIIP